MDTQLKFNSGKISQGRNLIQKVSVMKTKADGVHIYVRMLINNNTAKYKSHAHTLYLSMFFHHVINTWLDVYLSAHGKS